MGATATRGHGGAGPAASSWCRERQGRVLASRISPHRTETGTGSQQRGNSQPFLAGHIRASPSEQHLAPGCVTQTLFVPQQHITLQTWTQHGPTGIQTPSSSPLRGHLCLQGISALWRSCLCCPCPAHGSAPLSSITPAPEWQRQAG